MKKRLLGICLTVVMMLSLAAGCSGVGESGDEGARETSAEASDPAKEEKKDDLVGKEEQSRFSRMRQMNALRMEMKKAVHQENFERAAEIRDQIKALEAERKESKENKE